ncbi:MAG: cytochrome P450 [Actinobacteria bacterium]|nr:cytochrome P450 [Actinomycetota bacterium]
MAASEIDLSRLPPGPTGPSALVAMRFLLRGPHFLEACRDRYGPVFTIRLNTGRTVVIAGDPAIAKEVFQGSADDLYAGAGNVVLKPILGARSVLLLDGPEHLRQRRLMLPPFHGERMRAYGETMREVAERHVARWPVGRAFAVHPTMQAITLEIILRTVFGVQERADVERLAEPMKRLLNSTDQPLRLLSLQFTSSANAKPRSPWGRVYALMAPVDALIHEQIAARRADAEPRDDILSLLLAARDEDGNALTDAELRDELMTLLLAGHETTATALAWTVERLVRTPRVLTRLREEVESGEGTDYLDATIKEALRLRPVVPGVIRQLQRPLRIGGMELPAGVHVSPSIYLIHRRADVYPEPYAFRPERFLGEDAPGTYEWLPFGGGIRRCLGASFALYEMRIVLETVLRRAELETTDAASEPVKRRFVTYTPRDGGRVRVTRLAPAASPARVAV